MGEGGQWRDSEKAGQFRANIEEGQSSRKSATWSAVPDAPMLVYVRLR